MLVAVAAGVVLRLAQAGRAPIIEHDGAMYASLASAILRGDWAHGLSPLWPPLYPLMTAGVAAVACFLGAAWTPQVLEGSARAVSVLCGAAMLVPLYWLARRMLGLRGAQWALILALFHPRLVQYSAAALSEASFTLMLIAGLAAVTVAWRVEPAPETSEGAAPGARPPEDARRVFLEIAGGALFGLAYLIRPEGILVAAALWAAAIAMRRGAPPLVRLGPVFVLSAIVVSAPFIIFLHSQLGYWSLGEKGPFNFWREHRAAYAEVFPEPRGLQERASESPELTDGIPPARVDVAGFILKRPAAFAGRYFANLGTILASSFPVAVYHIFVLLAVLGAFAVPLRRSWPVLLVIAVLPLLYAAFSVDRRFFVPAIPLVLILAGGGMERLEERIARRTGSPARSARIAYAVAAALMISGIVYSIGHGFIDDAPEHRAAGERLGDLWGGERAAQPGAEERIDERPVVMSRKPWVAFYANGLIAELPEGSVEDVMARVRDKRCDVLVIDERWIASTRPRLMPLLDPGKAPSGLRVLYESDFPRRIVLYDASGFR